MVDTPSSEPRSGPTQGPAPEPFKRGRITWSRPPQPVFRVGPPPRGSVPLPSQGQRLVAPAPRRASGAGILSGSMIPGAAAPSTLARAQIGTATLPTPRPEAGSAFVPPPTEPPATPRLDPVAAAVEIPGLPEPAAVAPRERVPVARSEPVMPSRAAGVPPGTGLPTAVWIGAAVVALVLAAAVGWWMLKRDAPDPVVAGVATAPVETTTPLTAPPIAPVDAVPVTETPVVAAEDARAPATTAPDRTAPTTVAPSLTPRLNTEATVPRAETAPLSVAPVSSPPTAAEAPATDADAPIRTRPQPLS